ncbi:MAG TPA: DUF1674 domain-containing protein [Rhodanobacteraceae bacterium]|nr:DUF1674 domain-containing protein [Rhodanobacteraceae bacterium]
MPDPDDSDSERREPVPPANDEGTSGDGAMPREIGGRTDGLDPTRYGDWEKNGRCIDF